MIRPLKQSVTTLLQHSTIFSWSDMFEQFCIICEKKKICKITTCIREIIYKNRKQ